jgi:hypothetical protein
LILILPLTFGAHVAAASTSCDPAYVTQAGNEIIVSPTGVDDTANLQCAFDQAPAGATVRLKTGTYYTEQLVVEYFHGRFTGAGESRTTIVNLPEMYVTPLGFDQNPPSANNPWPVLIYFVGGDFSITDLAIHITGEKVTTPFQLTEDDIVRERLSSAIWVEGSGEVNVDISNFSITGEEVDNPNYDFNLAIGILAWGQPGGHFGSFHVLDSSFITMAVPIDLAIFANSDVLVSHNRFYNAVFGTWVEAFTDSSFEYSHNKLGAFIGLLIATEFVYEDTGNRYLVKTNAFRGGWGIYFDAPFGEGNQCLLLGNNVQNEEEVGIYLGPGIHGCTVVGGSNKTNVWDDGYDNILVGVNNMGAGVGPTIHDILKEMR